MDKKPNTSSFLQEAYSLLEKNDSFGVQKKSKKRTLKESTKKTLNEEKWVNIEDYLPDESYVESMDIDESFNECEKGRGHSAYFKDKVNERIDTYREMCNLDESAEITEEHIKKHNRELQELCLKKGGTPETVKQQLLKGKY